jgi:D-alanyl-D-alanine carboxypeptidase
MKHNAKRITSLLTALVLAISATVCASAKGAPETAATSICIMDMDTGRVLYEKNADEERAIASITKIMTGILVIENNEDLDRTIKISAHAASIGEASMYLEEGQKYPLRTVLYGTLLKSGNDAAVAVAEATGGSEKKFVQMMNRKAEELGMTHSHFSCPNGLTDEGNYSSARDMATLSRYAMGNKTFAKIVGTKKVTTEDGYSFTNHHKLLRRDERCIGIKTGFTNAAGRTLVSAFRDPEDGHRIIVVTLNDWDDYEDHLTLCDWAFKTFPETTLTEQDVPVATLDNAGTKMQLVTEEQVNCPLSKKEAKRVTSYLRLQSNRGAPIEEGATAGKMNYYLDGEKISSVKLRYQSAAS